MGFLVVDKQYFNAVFECPVVFDKKLRLFVRTGFPRTCVQDFWTAVQLAREASAEDDDEFGRALVSLSSSSEICQSSFSWIVQDEPRKTVYAVRDKWGRCGLLKGTLDGSIVLAHLPIHAGAAEWQDLGVQGVYKWACSSEGAELTTALFEWPSPLEFVSSSFRRMTKLDALENILRDSVCGLVQSNQCKGDKRPLGIFYSGGLDSTLLAALSTQTQLIATQHATVDLFSVSFDGCKSPDRVTSLLSFVNLCLSHPQTKFRLFLRDVLPNEVKQSGTRLREVLGPSCTVIDLTIGTALWFAAQCEGWVVEDLSTALLLLGQDAPDSQLLARLRARYYSTFPDIFCAEEEPERKPRAGMLTEKCAHCSFVRKPACAHQACRLCCIKKCRQPGSATCAAHKLGFELRASNEKDSLKPNEKDSLVVELLDARWAQLQAEGKLVYRSSEARVVLCGNGADELFGGYSRYRTREKVGGLQLWREEMVNDLARLWFRNLGRDDRCTLAAGRGLVVAFPFLEESVVRFVAATPVEILRHGVETEASPIYDTKVLLRQLAAGLGLQLTATLKKRAIQFGSRSSRLHISECSSKRKTKASTTIPA